MKNQNFVLRQYPKTIHFVKFCMVGVGNTALNYAVFYLLLSCQINYLIAGACGFLSGGVLGFFINRKWTFDSKVGTMEGLSPYLAVCFFSMLVNMGVQWWVTQGLCVLPVYSQLFGIAVTTVLNFLLVRVFVFQTSQ